MIEPLFSSAHNMLRKIYQSLIWLGVAAFMLTSSTAPKLGSITVTDGGVERPSQKAAEQSLHIKSEPKPPSLASVMNGAYEDIGLLP